MYGLSAYNSDLFKSYYCYVFFLPFEKSFNHYEKSFQFHPYIFLKKKLFINKYKKKYVIRKISLYFFGVIKHDQSFHSKACYFQYDHRFFFDREIGNNRTCRKVHLQKLVKFRLSGQYSFWHFLSCLKMKNHSHFLQSILIETSNVLLSFLFFTLPFLDIMKFRGLKYIKRYIFHYFL